MTFPIPPHGTRYVTTVAAPQSGSEAVTFAAPFFTLPQIHHVLLPVGTVLAGRYRIEQPLGAGAFGAVFAAWDLSLHRRVAVKVYDAVTGGQVSADEVRLQASCQHPHLMPLHDAGSDPLRGVTFLVLPLYPGADLRATLNRTGPMPFRVALGIADQIAGALEYLWRRRGVVHGDVKPSNIWLNPGGGALLMDFNLPGLLSRGGGPLTPAAGTPGYTAPEVLLRGSRDTRSDLFSLGCVLYECLAGVPPFVGQAEVQAGRFTPLGALRPDVRPALAAVIHRALAADPEARFQNLREFQTALRYPALATGSLAQSRLGDALRRVGGLVLAAAGTALRAAFLVVALTLFPAALRGAGRFAQSAVRQTVAGLRYVRRQPRQALAETGVALVILGYLVPHALFWFRTHRSVALLVGVPALTLLLIAEGIEQRPRRRRR